MTLGNTVALAQTNLKRLFAYSSIAHAGYLMVGVTVAFRNGPSIGGITLGSESVLFYLVSYALMTLGAFAVIIGLSTPERPVETVDDLAGLAKSHPIMALAMAICLFSLAGIPPLAGFIGKFNLFVAAFSASTDTDARMYQSLAVIGVLNSAIGAYYYLKIVVAMYYREPVGAPLKPRLDLADGVGDRHLLDLDGPARALGRADLQRGQGFGRGAGRPPRARRLAGLGRPGRRARPSCGRRTRPLERPP